MKKGKLKGQIFTYAKYKTYETLLEENGEE